MRLSSLIPLFAAVLAFGPAPGASAQTLAPQERLCDPTFQDCRADILTYIEQETQQIDMAFWMMSDARYSNALIAARQRGVTIRVLMDPRCAGAHPACVPPMDQLAAGGIPMRKRLTSGILHWKMILFASQGQVEFSGANYVPFETTPEVPWVNYTDEIIYFSNDPAVVRSLMTRFDDLWTSTTEFENYANITAPLTRTYPTYAIDPELNFPPDDSYRARAIQAYDAEQQKIDVFMFRVTDLNHTNGMLRALARGVPVRLITDEEEYRNPNRLWHAYNVDIMHRAGVQVRLDAHSGINHAKGVVLYGSGLSIFGSSNWTSPSSDTQREHNYFTMKPAIFDWIAALFERKWNNATGHTETKPFVPQPPNQPAYFAPSDGVTGVATSGVVLQWNAGLWAHLYDIYFGTTPNPPLLASNSELGPSQHSTNYRQFSIEAALQPGTTYYWRIVSKTMAHVTASGPVWSFTTAGTASNSPPSVSITGPSNGASFAAPASVTISASATDSDGSVARVEFYNGAALLGSDLTAPYSITWSNVGPGSYTLRAIAHDNAGAASTSASVSISVSGSSDPLPAGWSSGDVGSTGAAGSAAHSGGAFTIAGAGADVWGTTDQFHYAYRTLTGDGSIVARVASIQYVHDWTKVGVMIRNSLSPSAAHAFQLVAASSAKGVPFQRRRGDAAASISTPGSQATAPRWVKLVRAGNVITGYESADGLNWTTVGSDTFVMGSTVLIGLAVSSHVSGVNATATFDNVSVMEASQLPSGWAHGDIGATPIAGDASHGSGVFTVTGSGADIWGSADAFHYAYRTLNGDGVMVARVASIPQGIHAWVKAGVMIRASLAADSPHAFMLASAAKGMAFQRRAVAGGVSTSTAGTLSAAPRWVKLQRNGNLFTAYESADGVNWTLVGTESIAMGPTVYIGLAVTSHSSAAAACTFDGVVVQ